MASEIKTLTISAIFLIALTAIVLTGIAVTDGFGYALRTTTIVNDTLSNTVTLGAVNVSTAVGSTGTYPFLQALTGCNNATNVSRTDILPTSEYTIREGDDDGGFIRLNDDGAEWAGEAINCSALTYKADSGASDAADLFLAGFVLFATFSGILVLAVIGKTIVGLFRKD